MANTLISIVTVLAALGPGSEPSAPCNESIRQQDLKADLFFLAGDAFRDFSLNSTVIRCIP